jgi:uncharacterized protein (TIGR03000 family)
MSHKYVSLAILCVLVVVAVLWTPPPAPGAGPVNAPYGVLHHYGYYNPYAYTSRYLYYPFVGGGAYPWYDYRPYYGWSIVVPPDADTRQGPRRRAAYRPPDTPPGPAPAHITLKVPADAEVFFDGHKTSATGTVRQFDSPPLEPGYRYTYQLRARWRQNGRTVTRDQEVSVTRAARVTVAFPPP